MKERRYTPAQAARTLTLLRPVADDVRRHYADLRSRLAALRSLDLLEEITSDRSIPAPVRARLLELQSCLDELRQLGVVLLDPEIGLMSLPGVLADGTPVRFCWKLGETTIRAWYPEDGTYADRRPLVEVAAPV